MTEFHLKALRILADNPVLSQRSIAKELELSLGKANYIIKALVEKGYIKMKRFKNSNDKLAYMYVLTPVGIKKKMELTGKFLKKKSEEYRTLKREILALREEVENFDPDVE